MKTEKDYLKDLEDIRSMMERSSKFLSLSGWAGIIVGIYASAGAYIATTYFDFAPNEIHYLLEDLRSIIFIALGVFVLSLITAFFFSWRSAAKKGDSIWTATSKKLLESMAIPCGVGGFLSLVCVYYDLIGLVAPLLLIFYGLALYNASYYSVNIFKWMGLILIGLGCLNTLFIQFGLLFWVIGFGLGHMVTGILLYIRYKW